jgi:hypothetical protein
MQDRISIIFDRGYWLQRAEESRAIAAQMTYPEIRHHMLVIAEGYERIARHATVQAQIKEALARQSSGK